MSLLLRCGFRGVWGADVGFYHFTNRLHKSRILWCKFQSLYFIQRFISAICSIKRTWRIQLSVLSMKKDCITCLDEKKAKDKYSIYTVIFKPMQNWFYLNANLSVELSSANMRTFQASEMVFYCSFHPPQWLFDCSLLGRGVLNLSRRWWWMYLCVFYGMSIPVKCLF